MDDKIRCQSCGMPLDNGGFGTQADGSPSKEYCLYCYQGGEFTDPDMTVDKMVELSIDNMVNDLHMPQEKAEELAHKVIPQLKRWNHT